MTSKLTNLKKSFQVGTRLSKTGFRSRLRRRGNIWFVADNTERVGKERQQTRRKDKQQEQVHKRIWGKEQVLFCIRIFQTEEAEGFRQIL